MLCDISSSPLLADYRFVTVRHFISHTGANHTLKIWPYTEGGKDQGQKNLCGEVLSNAVNRPCLVRFHLSSLRHPGLILY